MKPQRTSASRWYCCKTTHPEPLEAVCYWEMEISFKFATGNSVRVKFDRRTSIPKPVENPWYVKGYSSSSTRYSLNPGVFISYNSHNIFHWIRRPKTIIKTGKQPHFQACQWDACDCAHAGRHAGKSFCQHDWLCRQQNKFYWKSHMQKFLFFWRLKRDLSFNFCKNKKNKIMNWTKHFITTVYM